MIVVRAIDLIEELIRRWAMVLVVIMMFKPLRWRSMMLKRETSARGFAMILSWRFRTREMAFAGGAVPRWVIMIASWWTVVRWWGRRWWWRTTVWTIGTRIVTRRAMTALVAMSLAWATFTIFASTMFWSVIRETMFLPVAFVDGL